MFEKNRFLDKFTAFLLGEIFLSYGPGPISGKFCTLPNDFSNLEVGSFVAGVNQSYLDRALFVCSSPSICLPLHISALVVGVAWCVVLVVPVVPVFEVQRILFPSFSNPFHNWRCKMTKVPNFPTREALK